MRQSLPDFAGSRGDIDEDIYDSDELDGDGEKETELVGFEDSKADIEELESSFVRIEDSMIEIEGLDH